MTCSPTWTVFSNEADLWRERFVRLFDGAYDDGSSPFNVVAVSYGDQVYEGGARVEYQHPAAVLEPFQFKGPPAGRDRFA